MRLPQGLRQARPVWKCKGCRISSSVTAGTIFADRKRPVRDYLLAIAIFANSAKGHTALQLSRDLDCQYRTAFVLAHKFREAIGNEQAPTNSTALATMKWTAHISAATSSLRTKSQKRVDRRSRKNRPASAEWLLSCASAMAARSFRCRQGK